MFDMDEYINEEIEKSKSRKETIIELENKIRSSMNKKQKIELLEKQKKLVIMNFEFDELFISYNEYKQNS